MQRAKGKFNYTSVLGSDLDILTGWLIQISSFWILSIEIELIYL